MAREWDMEKFEGYGWNDKSEESRIDVEDLLLNDEEIPSFKGFVKTFYRSAAAARKWTKCFDEWLFDLREWLEEVHEQMDGESEFIAWARVSFHHYIYHQYKKDLQAEIEMLVAGD